MRVCETDTEAPLPVNNKKPSIKRKPGVIRTAKPACLSPSVSPDAALEEALRAPLPSGPPPKKPPRTFQHDAFLFLSRSGAIDVTDGTERPARRNPPRPVSIAVVPFTMSRAKTETSLMGLKNRRAKADEDVADGLVDNDEWMDSFQWNGFSPERQQSEAQRRRMSCDGKRRETGAGVTLQQPHVYDQPSSDGDLHYMVRHTSRSHFGSPWFCVIDPTMPTGMSVNR